MSNRELTDFTDVMVDVITGYECNVKCDYCSVLDELRCQNMTTAEIIGEFTIIPTNKILPRKIPIASKT